MKVLARASPNIALIKYWGKSNADLIIPINSSFSLTLDNAYINTTTQVISGPWVSGYSLKINDAVAEFTPRMTRVIDVMREKATTPARDWGLKIESWNNFPTAAGMASSASGMACFSKA